MIRQVSAADVLPLRNLVLRPGKPLMDCRFDGDDLETTFHLGYFSGTSLVAIASFYSAALEQYIGKGYQLRGMATDPGFQNQGLGKSLLNEAFEHLVERGAEYVWCNARKKAYFFYSGLGFQFISDEFEIPGIGPHRVMYKAL